MTQPPSTFVRYLVQVTGMLVPPTCHYPRLYSAFALYSISAIGYCFGGCAAFIVTNGTAIEKLQSVGISITILNGLVKHTNAYLQQDKVTRLLDNFDTLWNELYADPLNRPQMEPIEKKCRKLFRLLIIFCTTVILINGLIPMIMYLSMGQNKLVFQILMPFDGNFVVIHLIQFLLTVSPFMANSIHNYLYYALSNQIGSFMAVLRRKLREERVDAGTVKTHQNIIRLTNMMNDLFGKVMYFETNTISIECSCAAYIIFRVNIMNGDRNALLSNMVLFVFCYLIPYVICYCGSMIKMESDAIFRDAYKGLWYESDMESRRYLRLLMLGASKPLTLHYKNLATFSMELFLGILNGTYTFLNALIWLEKAGTKTDHLTNKI